MLPEYFYDDVNEAIPEDVPQGRGRVADLGVYVDSDHTGDKLTRQSRISSMIFLEHSISARLSKKQPKIETSVYSAEFVAIKHEVEKFTLMATS